MSAISVVSVCEVKLAIMKEAKNQNLYVLNFFVVCCAAIMEWREVACWSLQRGKLQQLLHSGESMTPSRLGMTLPGPSSSPQNKNTESSAKRRPTIRPCANIDYYSFSKCVMSLYFLS